MTQELKELSQWLEPIRGKLVSKAGTKVNKQGRSSQVRPLATASHRAGLGEHTVDEDSRGTGPAHRT